MESVRTSRSKESTFACLTHPLKLPSDPELITACMKSTLGNMAGRDPATKDFFIKVRFVP